MSQEINNQESVLGLNSEPFDIVKKFCYLDDIIGTRVVVV